MLLTPHPMNVFLLSLSTSLIKFSGRFHCLHFFFCFHCEPLSVVLLRVSYLVLLSFFVCAWKITPKNTYKPAFDSVLKNRSWDVNTDIRITSLLIDLLCFCFKLSGYSILSIRENLNYRSREYVCISVSVKNIWTLVKSTIRDRYEKRIAWRLTENRIPFGQICLFQSVIFLAFSVISFFKRSRIARLIRMVFLISASCGS